MGNVRRIATEIEHRLRNPSRTKIVIAAAGLAAADTAYRLAGDSIFPGALFDETAHILTALLILWALPGAIRWRLLPAALIASVLIDVDHIPDRLGIDWITAGTPRPYTHSLVMIALVLVAARLWPRRRGFLLGFAAGLAIHFWRDMSESSAGVSLLWPFSDHAFRFGHGWYVAAMAIVTACALIRLRAVDRRSVSDGRLAVARPEPQA